MKRYGMIGRLKSGRAEDYIRLHADVWPKVLETIAACNIRNYSIFHKGDLLFSYFEYHGDDFDADMKKMAADPTTQEWWAVCTPCLEPVPEQPENTWWDRMTEVFHLD